MFCIKSSKLFWFRHPKTVYWKDPPLQWLWKTKNGWIISAWCLDQRLKGRETGLFFVEQTVKDIMCLTFPCNLMNQFEPKGVGLINSKQKVQKTIQQFGLSTARLYKDCQTFGLEKLIVFKLQCTSKCPICHSLTSLPSVPFLHSVFGLLATASSPAPFLLSTDPLKFRFAFGFFFWPLMAPLLLEIFWLCGFF